MCTFKKKEHGHFFRHFILKKGRADNLRRKKAYHMLIKDYMLQICLPTDSLHVSCAIVLSLCHPHSSFYMQVAIFLTKKGKETANLTFMMV